MKLSEMSTDRASDFLCEVTPYVTNIVTDEELLAELRNAVNPNEVVTRAELMAKGAEKITNLIPIVFSKRKTDVYGILAALNETTVDAIGAQNIIVTMSQVREVVKDRELMDFFRSCVGSEGRE